MMLAAFLLVVYFQRHGPGPGAIELTEAHTAVQADGLFEAPPDAAGPDLPAQAGQAIRLPHDWPRSIVPRAETLLRTADVHWLTITLPPSDGQIRHLYLPRWQTIGSIAIYADERLVYRSKADLMWNGFNHPLLLPLDSIGLPPPHLVHIRIASQVGAGGAVTRLWVGSEASLRPMFEVRQMLQVTLSEYAIVAVLGLAGFALCVWLKRPREDLYLMFAVFSLLFALRGLQYQVGLVPLPIDSAWFGWMSVNSHNAATVAWFYFISRLNLRLPAWPGRALLLLYAGWALLTLPMLSSWPLAEALAAMTYLMGMATGVPAMAALAWLAWRQRSLEGIAAATIGLVDYGLAALDLGMVTYTRSPDGIYTTPLMGLVHQTFFAYVLLNRHLAAIEGVERSNLVLAERLHAREAELSASHEQLREVKEREAVQRERQRLMQDLHDGMGSQLISALRVAETGQLDTAQMQTVLRECIDDLKLTVDSMEPVEADLLLLLATLRYRWTPRLTHAGLHIDWQVSALPPLPWLDPRGALHVLRILQEAFSNAVQHAGATRLRVVAHTDAHGVAVLVEDDGQGWPAGGFDLAAGLPSRQGRGLPNMLQRARAVGGNVEWQALDRGTQLRLWLPLDRAAVREPSTP